VRENELDEPQYGFSHMMATKAFLAHVGGYNHQYHYTENMELFFRAKDLGYPIAKLDEVMIARRFHTHNASSDTLSAKGDLLKSARASIERQRKSGSSGRYHGE
jgi:hypothetical protein